MKYSVKEYSKAFLGAVASGKAEKDIIVNFLNIVRKNGDWSKRSEIVREIEKEYFRSHGIKKVLLESVAPVSEEIKKQIKESLGGEVHFEERVEPELLAGLKIIIDDETLVDATAKRMMQSMFIEK